MAGMSILGTGSYTPGLTLTNQMFENVIDTSDEWIVTRTGIKSRAIAKEEESSLLMAETAAARALEDAGIAVSEIGVIICATLTGDYLTPSLACLLQTALGVSQDVVAMDINCGCAGFVYALKTAHSLLADMPDRFALVIGCEMLSRITDYSDRSTCVLFGDGAGAAIIKRTNESTLYFDCGSKGGAELLRCESTYICNSPFERRTRDATPSGVFMNGSEVFRFALETVPLSIRTLLMKAGVSADDVDHFVFHQANKRIIDNLMTRLRIDSAKCVTNIGHRGNTSSASVAIALDELKRSGRLKRGEKLIISSFGGGLTYAGLFFIW